MIRKIAAHFFSLEFLKFIGIGVINTATCTLFASLFSIRLNQTFSFSLGYLVSLSVAYILNSKFVFHRSMQLGAYFRFMLSYLPNFIIQNVLVFILIEVYLLNQFLVYILASILGVPITFLLVKFFAMNCKRTKGVDSTNENSEQ